MTRSVALLFALLGACTVGQAPLAPDGSGGGSGSGDGLDRNVCEDRAATVAPAYQHTSTPTGPRARLACIDAGCHAAGGGSTQFSFAGTVYKETSAVTPATGVTIRIFKPGNDKSLAEAVTDAAGNFRIAMGGTFTDFPYETHVTACGTSINIRPMVSGIASAEANCNTGGGCHGAAGGQGAIYLPD
jgi:hypothetical protein